MKASSNDIIKQYRSEIQITTLIKKMDLCLWLNINPYSLRTKHKNAICKKIGMPLEEYKLVTNNSFPPKYIQKLKEYIYEVAPHFKPEKEEKTTWKY